MQYWQKNIDFSVPRRWRKVAFILLKKHGSVGRLSLALEDIKAMLAGNEGRRENKKKLILWYIILHDNED